MPLGFKALGQVAWTPSLGVEALRKKLLGQDHQSRLKGNSKGERDLMISDFLAPVTEIFVFALILVSLIPRIISMSLPFP